MRWTLLFVLFLAYPPMGMTETRNIELCLAKDKNWSRSEHKARMKELGIQCATVYYSLNTPDNRAAPYAWVQEYLDEGYTVIMVLRIDADGNNPLHETLSGGNDTALNDLLFEIRQDGRPITVRLWHESDGNWYPWQMYYPGNSIQLLVEAFKYLHTTFDEAGVLSFVTLESNFNRRDAPFDTPLTEGNQYVPQIDAVVSAHSGSSYNRCGSRAKYPTELSFASEFGPFYDRNLVFTDKPVNIAEVSTSGLCTDGEKLQWFRDMLESVDTRFTRVETITFVFGTVAIGEASNDVEIPWGFSTDAQRAAFADLLNEYRRKWGQPEVLRITRNESKPKLDLSFGADSAPWSVWTKLTYPFDEIDNTAINANSGVPFGETGPVFQLRLKQQWLTTVVGRKLKLGPGIQAGALRSENDEQWWFNYDYVGITFGAYRSGPRNAYISWGNFYFEVVGTVRQYRTDRIPERLEGTPGWLGIQTGFSFGGDQSR